MGGKDLVVRSSSVPAPASALDLREVAARVMLNDVRQKGHIYVELRRAGKRSIFFCTLCLTLCYSDPDGPTIFSQLIKLPDDLAFLTCKDDGLADLEIIGRDGCGEVYKTQLPSDPSKLIAVKKIRKRTADGAEPTVEEIGLLDKWMRQIRLEILTVFIYKLIAIEAQKAWMKNPEVLRKCSTCLHFPSDADENYQEKQMPLKLLHFSRADALGFDKNMPECCEVATCLLH